MPRLLVACAAALLIRAPAWRFLVNVADIQKVSVWFHDFALVCSWDCDHYAKLAESPAPAAFFPLLPLLAHAYDALTDVGGKGAVLFLANLAAWAAGVLTLYVGHALWEAKDHRRWLGFAPPAWLLLAVTGLFPHSHAWIRGYPEPLFYCLLLGAVLALLRGRLEWAGLCVGLSAVARPQGLYLAVALGVLLLASRWRPAWLGPAPVSLGRCVVAKALAWLPFAAFMAWCWRVQGDALYFLTAQRDWHRDFSLMQGLGSHLPELSESYVYLLASLAAAWAFVRRGGVPWAFVGLASLLMAELPLFVGGFYSYPRFMSTNLGLLCLLVEGSRRWPLAGALWLGWSLTQLAVVTHDVGFLFWVG